MDLIAQTYGADEEAEGNAEGSARPGSAQAPAAVEAGPGSEGGVRGGDAEAGRSPSPSPARDAKARPAASSSSEYTYTSGSTSGGSESETSDSDSDSSSSAAEMLDSLIKSKGWEALNAVDSDDEGNGAPRTHNEEIPKPVPPVDVAIAATDEVASVGEISAIVSDTVVVAMAPGAAVYDIGSLLCVPEGDRKSESEASAKAAWRPLGYVDEVFGPVKAPLYSVRVNEADLGTCEVGFKVGALTRVSAVVVEQTLRTKGYDNSGRNDEECDQEAFSDDEEERAHRRRLKEGKAAKGGQKRTRGGGPRGHHPNRGGPSSAGGWMAAQAAAAGGMPPPYGMVPPPPPAGQPPPPPPPPYGHPTAPWHMGPQG